MSPAANCRGSDVRAMKQWLLGGEVPEHIFIPAVVAASESKT